MNDGSAKVSVVEALQFVLLTSAELTALHGAGQDGEGLLRSMAHKASDLIAMLRLVIGALPDGPNRKTLQAQLAALTSAAERQGPGQQIRKPWEIQK